MRGLVLLIGLAVVLAIALPHSTLATSLNEVKKLTASDAVVGDAFGTSVTVSGDTAVVGATGEVFGGSGEGAAYIYQQNQGGADNWGEVAKLTASDAQFEDIFGWSVAISGDTAIVGALSEDTGGTDAGAAYVFRRDEGGADNWGEVKKLTASGAQAGDSFGVSVAVNSGTTVIGAWQADTGSSLSGAAYVFERDNGGIDNWGEVKKLTAPDAEAGHSFGIAVSVNSNIAIVGAFGNDAATTNWSGAAYVFQRDQGGADNWGDFVKLTASDAHSGDALGISVAISADTVVAGAYTEDTGGIDAGAAYVFDLLQPKLTPTPVPPSPEMRLVVIEPANACVGNQCQVGTGETFKLGVEIVAGPSEVSAGAVTVAAGYILAQTSIFYGSDIIYDFSAPIAGEIVWPDCEPAVALKSQIDRRLPIVPSEDNTIELVSHGCITGLLNPQPSEFIGLYLELDMGCSPEDSSSLIELLPYDRSPGDGVIAGTSGTLLRRPGQVLVDDVFTDDVPPTVNTLTLDCVDVAPAAVGGISLESELQSLPLETGDPSSSSWSLAIGFVVAAGLAAVGGAAWYARRRLLT